MKSYGYGLTERGFIAKCLQYIYQYKLRKTVKNSASLEV